MAASARGIDRWPSAVGWGVVTTDTLRTVRWWKIVGLAGLAGVAATTGYVVVRHRRSYRELDNDDLRARLHARLAQAE